MIGFSNIMVKVIKDMSRGRKIFLGLSVFPCPKEMSYHYLFLYIL